MSTYDYDLFSISNENYLNTNTSNTVNEDGKMESINAVVIAISEANAYGFHLVENTIDFSNLFIHEFLWQDLFDCAFKITRNFQMNNKIRIAMLGLSDPITSHHSPHPALLNVFNKRKKTILNLNRIVMQSEDAPSTGRSNHKSLFQQYRKLDNFHSFHSFEYQFSCLAFVSAWGSHYHSNGFHPFKNVIHSYSIWNAFY